MRKWKHIYKQTINDTERGKSFNNPTYREEDENNHQSTHWDSARSFVFVLREEEEGGQANLLDIHAYKNVLDCLGEEQATGLTGRRLIKLPGEGVLPCLIEHEERETRKTIDDGGDQHVS